MWREEEEAKESGGGGRNWPLLLSSPFPPFLLLPRSIQASKQSLPPCFSPDTLHTMHYYSLRFANQFLSKEIKKNPFTLLLCLLEYSNTVPYFFRVMDSRKCPPPMSLPASPPHKSPPPPPRGCVGPVRRVIRATKEGGGDGKARAGAEPMVGKETRTD